MDSALTFLLGVLIASTKALAFAALGFGIAWWRSRTKLRRLEAQHSQIPGLEERLDRLESSLDYVGATLERLAAGQDELRALLPSGTERGARALPAQPAPAEGPTTT